MDFMSRSFNSTPLIGGVYPPLTNQNLDYRLVPFPNQNPNLALNGKWSLRLLLLMLASGSFFALKSKAKAEEDKEIQIHYPHVETVVVPLRSAPFKKRVIAFLMDILFTLVLSVSIPNGAIISFIIQLYYINRAKTLGKSLVGLTVVEMKTGKPASLGVMLLHEFLKYIGNVALIIDVSSSFFARDCLHNIICDTVTVEEK